MTGPFFREKQREATERYQRAHIPQRRRFSSPVLDKAYSAPLLHVPDNNLHSLSDTRFQTMRPKTGKVGSREPLRDEVQFHTARTIQSRAAFTQVSQDWILINTDFWKPIFFSI